MVKSAFSFVLGGAVALLGMLPATTAHAQTVRFRYVAIDKVPLPPPFTAFIPSVVINSGRVFGTVFDTTFTISHVAEFNNGVITIGPAGTASTANVNGIIGGANPSLEAALFNGHTTTVIPPLPGFAFAHVTSLADSNLALVQSTNNAFVGSTFSYFLAGRQTVIDFGLPDPVLSAFVNDAALVALNKATSATDPLQHGFRFDPSTGKSTPLPPFAGDKAEVNVLIQGINTQNQVLGTSFVNSGPYHEHVGVWSIAAVFQPFVEETIQASALAFNNRDEIVITSSPSCPSCDDSQCFLVPSPGTRLDLQPLVEGVPAGFRITQSFSIDDTGNITGVAVDASDNTHPFLLQPI
jgi:hypothetical protein